MDSWKAEEVAKMKLGGNKSFRSFLQGYEPAAEGGYREGMSAQELYHSWAATQWREKLSKELANEAFTPSSPPPGFGQPSRPTSSQSVRKSRPVGHQAQRRQSSLRNSQSPSPVVNPPGSPPPNSIDQRAANESFFENLGKVNASRPDNLPPSQGGKYSGFGSSPSPPPQRDTGSPDSFALSSQNLPTFQDLSQNPMGALSKGWSIFSGAVAGAGKTVNENILQPGMERVRAEAPGVQQRLGAFAGEAGKKLGEVHGVVKDKTGMDVQESWGALMGKMRDLNMGPNPTRQGYQGVGNDGWVDHGDETSALYHDDDGAEGEDFFDKFEKPKASEPTTSSTEGSASTKPAKHVEKEGWDDWKEF